MLTVAQRTSLSDQASRFFSTNKTKRKSCFMKNEAIKEHHLYNKTFARGARFVGRLVSIHVLKDYAAKKRMLAHPMKKYTNRIGLSVTKKIGGAVVRNRAKRILRAAYETCRPQLSTGFLIVISAREAIHGIKSPELARELTYGFTKLGMMGQAPIQKPKETNL